MMTLSEEVSMTVIVLVVVISSVVISESMVVDTASVSAAVTLVKLVLNCDSS